MQAARSTSIPVANAQSDTTFLQITDALARHEVQVPAEVRDRLAHLEKLAAVGLFTSSIAHEIKNALVGIKTCVQLAAGHELAPLAGRELLRIESLVNLLLQYASKTKQDFARVELNAVIQNAARTLEPTIKTKNLLLRTQFEAAPDTIDGHGPQLEQALLNLLLNAAEATPAGGTVAIKSYNEGSQVRVELRDSGPGILAEDLGRIFEPFYTTKARGSGLGLGITRRIVRDHNGTIEVASPPGSGATFTLSFPAAT